MGYEALSYQFRISAIIETHGRPLESTPPITFLCFVLVFLNFIFFLITFHSFPIVQKKYFYASSQQNVGKMCKSRVINGSHLGPLWTAAHSLFRGVDINPPISTPVHFLHL